MNTINNILNKLNESKNKITERRKNLRESTSTRIFEDHIDIEALVKDPKKLKELLFGASIDTLTQAFNRKGFEEQIAKIDDFSNMGMIVLDIDNFKHLNDSFGHNVGDDVLKVVSRTADSVIRSGDLFMRYGGDEFVILLHDIHNKGDLADVAYRIVTEIANKRIKTKNDELVRFTVTVGCGLYDVNEDYMTNFKRIDGALLYNKRNSKKNAFVIA